MILAAGRGERLRPLTDTIPKPLVQVGDHRLIEYHLLALRKAGYRRIVINTGYLGVMIKQELQRGDRYGVEIHYTSEPDPPLETAGGIANALALLGDEVFLVVNGDIRCQIDYGTLVLPENATMHLKLVNNPSYHPDGDFAVGADQLADFQLGKLTTLASEPNRSEHMFTFSGAGVYRADLFSSLPSARYPLAPLIHRQIEIENVAASFYSGPWIDVGTPERLELARQLVHCPSI